MSVLSNFPVVVLKTFRAMIDCPEVNWNSGPYSFSIENGIATIEVSDESGFHFSCAVNQMSLFIDEALVVPVSVLEGKVHDGASKNNSVSELTKLNSLVIEKPSWMASPSQAYDENVTR